MSLARKEITIMINIFPSLINGDNSDIAIMYQNVKEMRIDEKRGIKHLSMCQQRVTHPF